MKRGIRATSSADKDDTLGLDFSFKGDIEFLFDALDINNVKMLSESEVKFLDGWDVEWEDWQVTTKQQLDRAGSNGMPGNRRQMGRATRGQRQKSMKGY